MVCEGVLCVVPCVCAHVRLCVCVCVFACFLDIVFVFAHMGMVSLSAYDFPLRTWITETDREVGWNHKAEHVKSISTKDNDQRNIRDPLSTPMHISLPVWLFMSLFPSGPICAKTHRLIYMYWISNERMKDRPSGSISLWLSVVARQQQPLPGNSSNGNKLKRVCVCLGQRVAVKRRGRGEWVVGWGRPHKRCL